MVNQIVLDYLSQNSGKYELRDLKEKILLSGYSQIDLDEAIKILGLESSQVKTLDNSNNHNSNNLDNFSNKNNNLFKGIRWMRIGGILGIILIILSLLILVASYFSNQVSANLKLPLVIGIFSISFIMFILSLFFLYSFARMGRAGGSKLLSFAAKTLIVISILLIVLSLGVVLIVILGANSNTNSSLGLNGNVISDFSQSLDSSSGLSINPFDDLKTSLGSFFWLIAISLALFILFVLIIIVLFFVGLIFVGKQIRFARLAGILGLFTLVISIIFPIAFVGFIFSNFILILTNPGLLILIGSIFSISFSVLSFLVLLLESLALFDGSRKFEAN